MVNLVDEFSPEIIQAAIAKERSRQLIERIFEELAEESECWSSGLSPAEMVVAIQIALTGESAVGIAENLNLSPRTVQSHIGNIYAKTGCKTKALLQAAVTQKLLEMWADG